MEEGGAVSGACAGNRQETHTHTHTHIAKVFFDQVAPLTADELNNNDIYNYKPSRDLTSPSAATSDDNNGPARTSNRRTNGSIVDQALNAANNASNDSYRIPTPPPPPPPPSGLPPRRNYAIERDDSIDELVKAIKAPRKRVTYTTYILRWSHS